MLIYLVVIMSKTIDHEIETLIREFINILSQFLVLSLSLDNKKVSWRHRNVVLNFFRLFLFWSISRLIVYWFDRLIDVYYSN